jgi:hypothetical protein
MNLYNYHASPDTLYGWDQPFIHVSHDVESGILEASWMRNGRSSTSPIAGGCTTASLYDDMSGEGLTTVWHDDHDEILSGPSVIAGDFEGRLWSVKWWQYSQFVIRADVEDGVIVDVSSRYGKTWPWKHTKPPVVGDKVEVTLPPIGMAPLVAAIKSFVANRTQFPSDRYA